MRDPTVKDGKYVEDQDARVEAKEESREEKVEIIKLKNGKKVPKDSKLLAGVLSEVIYGGVNDFVICKIDGVTCKGRIKEPVVGASYSLNGKYVWNDKYKNWNFEFDSFEVKIDEERGLIQYLAREAPGLGPALSQKLVALHGFRVMELLRGTEPVPGISAAQHKTLQAWARDEDSNSSMKERLYSIGLTKSQVAKLLNHYGSNAELKIRKDCFSLTEIHGFGFKTVSAIANLIGIPTHDPGRVKAAIVYAADALIEDGGHVMLRLGDVVTEACALLALKQDVVLPVLIEILEQEELLVHEKVRFREYREKRGIVLA